MANIIRGILVSTKSIGLTVLDIADELQSYYKLLNCDTIDIVRRKIAGHTVHIVLDDEGLLKNNPQITAASLHERTLGESWLVGNLFICDCDEFGELKSLSSDMLCDILQRVRGNGNHALIELD